jgi:hypothetical protein
MLTTDRTSYRATRSALRACWAALSPEGVAHLVCMIALAFSVLA